jgi:Ca2+/H+ antiporter, TMEM165/GDT1 family
MSLWLFGLTAFVASAVEAVEAATIVMAVGYARNWRVALSGAVYACLALIAIVAIGGPVLLAFVPIQVLRFVIGAFLIWFGFGWLRKSILRYGGRIALHDEEAIFQREVATARNAAADRAALGISFNGVFLEGLEVVIIVITVGAASRDALVAAAAGAVVAGAIVAAAAALLRNPLSRVPENAMKFIVGIMLTSFGIFWLGEAARVPWWHGDLSVVVLAVAILLASTIAIGVIRRTSFSAQS